MTILYRLDRYIFKQSISSLVMILLGLVSIALLMDYLGSVDEIQEIKGGTQQVMLYFFYRIPIITSKLIAIIALLSALLVMAKFVYTNELVAMRAGGISQFHLMRSFFPVALVLIVLQAGLDNFAIPGATSHIRDLVATQDQADSALGKNLWFKSGNTIIHVEKYDLEKGYLKGFQSIKRDDQGEVVEVLSAQQANFSNGQWYLENANVMRPSLKSALEYEERAWEENLPLNQIKRLTLHPSELNVYDLYWFVSNQSYGNQPQYLYFLWLNKKLAVLLATFLMVMLAIPMAQRFQRDVKVGVMLMYGVALGFAYLGLDSFALSLGESGLIPPLIAAWVPSIIVLCIILTIAFIFETR